MSEKTGVTELTLDELESVQGSAVFGSGNRIISADKQLESAGLYLGYNGLGVLNNGTTNKEPTRRWVEGVYKFDEQY